MGGWMDKLTKGWWTWNILQLSYLTWFMTPQNVIRPWCKEVYSGDERLAWLSKAVSWLTLKLQTDFPKHPWDNQEAHTPLSKWRQRDSSQNCCIAALPPKNSSCLSAIVIVRAIHFGTCQVSWVWCLKSVSVHFCSVRVTGAWGLRSILW